MSLLYRPECVTRLGAALFTAAGALADQALETAESLVTSSLMGHDSHGVIRIPEYLGFVADGSIVVNAPIHVERTGATTAVLDCGHSFGPCGALRAIREGIAIAREQRTACVITRRCNHVGRLGAYVQRAAEEGMLAIATCNSPIHGHHVLPWGGRDRRLGTNPIAYAVPTGALPVVADFSTSVAPRERSASIATRERPCRMAGSSTRAGTPRTTPMRSTARRAGEFFRWGQARPQGICVGLLVEILGSAGGISSQDEKRSGTASASSLLTPLHSARSNSSGSSWIKPWPT